MQKPILVMPEMRSLLKRSAQAVAIVGALACAASLQAGETRRVEGLEFDELLIFGPMNVEVRQGEPAELQIQGPDGLTDKVKYRISGDTLTIGSGKSGDRKVLENISFRVILPQLQRLKLKGSGDVYVKPFDFTQTRRGEPAEISLEGSGDIKLYGVQGPSLELRVKGSGNIKALSISVAQLDTFVAGSGGVFIQTLQAKDAELTVTGSGDATVTEESFIESLEVNVIGSGDANLETVDCEKAEINIVGSGDVRIGRVTKLLAASILGSGDVRYRGDPDVDSIELGSGEVRRSEERER
ncbi:MAG: DUF2807 domain-containing protein [Congregibacter sp.]